MENYITSIDICGDTSLSMTNQKTTKPFRNEAQHFADIREALIKKY